MGALFLIPLLSLEAVPGDGLEGKLSEWGLYQSDTVSVREAKPGVEKKALIPSLCA